MIDVVAALIQEQGRFLLCQRPSHKARGLKWEFPGGKIEKGETPEQAIIRECSEELDIELSVQGTAAMTLHHYPDISICLTLLRCTIISGTPKLKEHIACAWVSPGEAVEYDLAPADRELLQMISF
jgi:8-oxo-dGTP diphosphatase